MTSTSSMQWPPLPVECGAPYWTAPIVWALSCIGVSPNQQPE